MNVKNLFLIKKPGLSPYCLSSYLNANGKYMSIEHADVFTEREKLLMGNDLPENGEWTNLAEVLYTMK